MTPAHTVWTALVLLGTGTPQVAGPVDAVILPIRATAMSLPDARPVTLLVEEAFAAAFTRHHPAPVLTAAELRATLSREAQAQLTGCDQDACFQEVLDALHAPHVVIVTLDVSPGLWTLTAAVADRRSGEVLRRREIRSRSLEALLESLDTMCRSLDGAAFDVADPRLASRLSTNNAGVALLKRQVQAQPSADPIASWTALVTEANRENRLLDLAAGGLFAGAGLLALAAAALHGLGNAVGIAAITQQPQPPVFWVLLPAMGVGMLLAGAGALVAGAVAVVVVDMMDLGRIPVGKNGCCRDETRLRQAGATHPLSWLAVGLSVVGLAAATLSVPMAVAAFIVGNILWNGLGLTTLDVAPPPSSTRYVLIASAAWTAYSGYPVALLVIAPLMGAITLGLLWLVRDTTHAVVDDQPPPQPPPAAAPPRGARVKVNG